MYLQGPHTMRPVVLRSPVWVVHPVRAELRSPGHRIIRFHTARGRAVLAVDARYLYRSLESMIPPGIHIHVDDVLRALETVKDLADAPDLIFAGTTRRT